MTVVDPEHQISKDSETTAEAGAAITVPVAAADQQPSTDTHNLRKGIALGVAGTLLAGGAYKAMSGGGDSEPVRSTNPAAAESNEPVTSLPDNPTETTITVEVPDRAVEKPQLMTATTPTGIVEELIHNIECAYNNNFDYDNVTREVKLGEAQQECLRFMFGNSHGDLSDVVYKGSILESNKYRLDHPDFRQELSVTDVKGEVDEYSAVIVATVKDAGQTKTKRFTFERVYVDIEQLAPQDQETQAWILTKEAPLKAGEVTFE